MMRYARIGLLVALVALVGACEETAPPTAPTPTPTPTTPPPPVPALRANLTPAGSFQFTNCFDVGAACTFTAALRNVGTGCAEHVGGTVRFLGLLGVQVGATRLWTLPPQEIVTVGETVPYFVTFVPAADAAQIVDYIVTPTWIDTACF